MTARELIELLKTVDPDTKIHIEHLLPAIITRLSTVNMSSVKKTSILCVAYLPLVLGSKTTEGE